MMAVYPLPISRSIATLSAHPLTRGRPLRGNVDRVERLVGSHEQSVALGSAKADVGDDLRQTDAADQLALGVPYGHPVVPDDSAGIARAPQIAVDVAACAVRPAL